MTDDDALAAGVADACTTDDTDAYAIAQHEPPKPHGDPLANAVPTEAPAPDTYGTAEAAKLLGLSDRRVRQLIAEGQLPGEHDDAGVLRLPQQAVHAERARRRKEAPASGAGRKPTAAPTAITDVDAIAAAVEAAVSRVLVGQLELTAQAQSIAEAERRAADQERSRRLELEAEVVQLRAQLDQATAAPPEPEAPRARWWRRK